MVHGLELMVFKVEALKFENEKKIIYKYMILIFNLQIIGDPNMSYAPGVSLSP